MATNSIVKDAEDVRWALRKFDNDTPVYLETSRGVVPVHRIEDWADGVVLRPEVTP